MITREQVADLQPGDVVSLTDDRWPPGTEVGGPCWEERGALRCGSVLLRDRDGDPGWNCDQRNLTVVSRAPRPLYVNHPRTEPVTGDVVKPERGRVRHGVDQSAYGEFRWWGWDASEKKWLHTSTDSLVQHEGPLTLLVDGGTGQVVP